MKREKSLVKNTIIISIGKIGTSLITFLLLPVYTSILTTSEYGIVDLLNTLVGLLVPIVTLQLEKAVFRNLVESRNNKKKISAIISTSIFSIIVQCFIFFIIFILVSDYLKFDYKIYLGINVVIYIFSTLFLQMARGLGDNKKYTIGSFISALFTILFNILFVVFIRMGAEGMLLGTFLGQLTCCIYLFFYLGIRKYFQIRNFDRNLFKEMCKYSLPLIPNAISWWIFNASDRLIVSYVLGLSATGILSAALKFSAACISIYGILDMTWTESIAVHIKDVDIESYFNNMFRKILGFFSSAILLVIAIMPFAFPLLINESFSEGYNLIPISLLGCLFNIIVGLISVIYIAKKDSKAIARTSILSAIINIIVHIAFIQYIGLFAAVVSTCIAYATLAIYRFYDIKRKYLNIKINYVYCIKFTIILLFIVYIYYLKNMTLNIISIPFVILYIILHHKKDINFMIGFLKTKLGVK